MAIQLNETQIMTRDMVRKLAENEFAPKAAEIDREERFPWDNIKRLAEYGIFGINVPEKYGGTGADMIGHTLAVEEVARACCSTSVAVTTQALTMAPIILAGTHEQKLKFLTPLAEGRVLGSFGLTEPGAGSDAAGITTTAVKNGDSYILNGTKNFITNAGESQIYVIAASTDRSKGTKGISLFLVEKGTSGLSFGNKEQKMGIRGSVTREVVMTECRVPAENLLGLENQGFRVLMHTFNHTRPSIAAQAVGLAQGAFEASLRYVKERKQFGQTLGSFQMIQAMLADMATQIEAARLLVHLVASKIDAGEQNVSAYAAMAKMFASDTAMKVTTDSVQVHGGYGYTREYPVERMMRDAKILQIYEGTNQIQRLVISKALLA